MMVEDLSSRIESAEQWNEDEAHGIAQKLAAGIHGSTDCDDENWICIFTPGREVAGLVHTQIKLVLHQKSSGLIKEQLRDIELVEFTAYQGVGEFSMRPELLGGLIGGSKDGWAGAEIDPMCFSAADLWYLTVH